MDDPNNAPPKPAHVGAEIAARAARADERKKQLRSLDLVREIAKRGPPRVPGVKPPEPSPGMRAKVRKVLLEESKKGTPRNRKERVALDRKLARLAKQVRGSIARRAERQAANVRPGEPLPKP